MRLILISGKIGSGKSTICKCLQKKGYLYINSDKLAKDLILSNIPLKEKLQKEFNILKDGSIISLNKLKLLFLSSKDYAAKINSIIHPIFFKELNILLSKTIDKVVLELPLIETMSSINKKFKVIAIDTKLDIRKKRYLLKNKANIKDFMILNNYQKSSLYYKNSSEHVISNNDTIELLKIRFNKLYSKLKNE
ncbi:MAG: dephospho-CoA kinase [Gammaproteobacteria bacterium]|nr:dephospho-CoA kinase [Gammaproteobacteria bacterium]|tara:strand:- start:1626 stop:2204 length:579 start_codon:yes stop_codon:yes gene_type:complete